jgi:hypothetical protein
MFVLVTFFLTVKVVFFGEREKYFPPPQGDTTHEKEPKNVYLASSQSVLWKKKIVAGDLK